MSIWFKPYTLKQANERGLNTLFEHLNIEITELGEDYIVGTMPVDHRTKQPAGILHGGASVALAESLASLGSNLILDPSKEYGVGLEINANHIRSCTGGKVEGRAHPVHRGRTTQIWEIHIKQEGKLVCMSRMTLAILQKPNQKQAKE